MLYQFNIKQMEMCSFFWPTLYMVEPWLYHSSRSVIDVIVELIYWENRQVTGSKKNIDNIDILSNYLHALFLCL